MHIRNACRYPFQSKRELIQHGLDAHRDVFDVLFEDEIASGEIPDGWQDGYLSATREAETAPSLSQPVNQNTHRSYEYASPPAQGRTHGGSISPALIGPRIRRRGLPSRFDNNQSNQGIRARPSGGTILSTGGGLPSSSRNQVLMPEIGQDNTNDQSAQPIAQQPSTQEQPSAQKASTGRQPSPETFGLTVTCGKGSPKHTHTWRTSGELQLMNCERKCLFCKPHKRLAQFLELRNHVARFHADQMPNLRMYWIRDRETEQRNIDRSTVRNHPKRLKSSAPTDVEESVEEALTSTQATMEPPVQMTTSPYIPSERQSRQVNLRDTFARLDQLSDLWIEHSFAMVELREEMHRLTTGLSTRDRQRAHPAARAIVEEGPVFRGFLRGVQARQDALADDDGGVKVEDEDDDDDV